MGVLANFGGLNYFVLGVYLAGMVLIGVLFARRQSSTEEYFLAGRRMPWLVVGMSMYASLTSAVTYMAVPGFAYGNNVAIFFGVVVSPLVTPILIFVFYPVYHKYNVTTSYEYILHRYGKGARFAVSGLFVLARVGWLGAVIYAPAIALSVVTGINLYVAIGLMGVLATVYTELGGLSAVLWTDVAQFVILIGGAVWIAVSLICKVDGGLGGIVACGVEAGRFDVFDWRVDLGKMTAISAMVCWFFMFMQDYGTDQVTVQRLLAIRKRSGVGKAVIFNSINDVLITSLLLFIGIALLAFYGSDPSAVGPGLKADKMLPFYIIDQLPVGVSGLVITAIFAAAMSSMDSGLNSISTVIVNDFIKPLRKTAASEKMDVKIARRLTILLGVLATAAAFGATQVESIIKMWSSVMSLFGGPVLAIFLMGILFKRANFAGWVVGCGVSVLCTAVVEFCTEVSWVYYFPLSFASCFVVGMIGSYAFTKGNNERIDIMKKSLLFVAVLVFAAWCLSVTVFAKGSGVFVSVDGSDAGNGSKGKPYATLEAARDKAREMVAAGEKDVTVWLGDGYYYRDKTLALGKADSGVVYRAVNQHRAHLVGGKKVKAANFKAVTDAGLLKRMDDKARGKIVELDLAEMGFVNIKKWADTFATDGGAVRIYFDAKMMPMSRYPNDGFMTMKKVLVNGGGQETAGQWADYYGTVGHKRTKTGTKAYPGVFEYRDDRHLRWITAAEEGGLWLKGYWRVPWQNEAVRVDKIDTEKRTVQFAGMVSGGIGSKYKRPEGSGKERYWAMNLLEEIDMPGEWSIDFGRKKLFFWPVDEITDDNVTISDLAGPIVLIMDGSDITVRDIALEVGLANAVDIVGGSGNLVAGCSIRNFAKAGVVIKDGVKNGVRSCDIFNMGAGGVYLSGGDVKTKKAAGHFAVNNYIHHYAEIERVYAAAVIAGYKNDAVGMHVANNLIHDTPHVGILFGSCDNVFEYNDIYNICQVSNDMGGLYSFIQTDRQVAGGNTIRYNFIHHSPEAWGVYFDCDDPGDVVHGNVTYKVDIGVIYKDFRKHHATNNLVVDSYRKGYQAMVPGDSVFENNVAIRCGIPFDLSGKERWARNASERVALPNNLAVAGDPGFESIDKMDFRIKENSAVFAELKGFEQIPMDKIGLFVDEYRKVLPKKYEKLDVKETHFDAPKDSQVN